MRYRSQKGIELITLIKITTLEMIKKFGFLLLLLQFTACTELQNLAGTLAESSALSSAEVGQGLKQALEIGIGKGSDQLSQLDGYYKSSYKILLPEEARKITDKLKIIPGFDKVEDIILEKINRGAEDAAKKAKPIFVSAIKQMTFDDAMNILMGNKNSATTYLNTATRTQLYSEFSPIVNASLDKFDANEYWSKLVKKYNAIPFTEDVNSDLGDYVTNQALNGLFGMVEKEELNIRTNFSARTNDLLKKVFAKQDN
ncbi:MAG: hypothetical protein ACI8P3_000280 [Saprospiraceae bacterium]